MDELCDNKMTKLVGTGGPPYPRLAAARNKNCKIQEKTVCKFKTCTKRERAVTR